jgi:uncharacterized protein (TIGR03067 family)
MMRVAWLAAFLTFSLVLAEGKKPVVKDRDAILGSWRVVSREQGGKKSGDEYTTLRVTFTLPGQFRVEDKVEARSGTFKLIAGKQPRQIQIRMPDSSKKGIYLLDGDTLKLCADKPGRRPTDFKTAQGSDAVLLILKREK